MMQGPVLAPPPIPADPNLILPQIIPLIGGIAALVVGALVVRWLLHSPIGEAMAEGIRMRRRRRYGLTGESVEEPRVNALEEQVRLLTVQVSELGERLDFTERMLVGGRQRRVGGGD